MPPDRPILHKPPSSPKDSDAFPTAQLTVLALCRLSEPIAFCSILAYTYVMVIDLQGGDDTDASFYAGLLVSAFAVAEACTAMMWGFVSDFYGRKPIVLSGLAGVAISSLIFGFAERYWVALVARLVGGLLNGNVAVMQTMVAEMVKKPEHEPTAYAVQPFMWSLGSILGAAMGGFLAQPAKFYPKIFSQDGIFGRYPYLLPNLVAAVVIMLSILQGIIFLKETNPRFHQPTHDEQDETEHAISDERSPLLQPPTGHSSVRRISALEGFRPGSRRTSFVADGGTPTTNDPSFDIRRESMNTIHSIHIIHPRSSRSKLLNPTLEDGTPRAFNRGVITITIALVLMCYHQMAFGALLPIYLLDKPIGSTGGFQFWGGLGYTVHSVGIFMSVNGVIALAIQGLIFPFFVSRVGVWTCFVVFALIYPISYIIMPFISALPTGVAMSAGVYLGLIVQNFFAIIYYPCALILLKNAAPSSLVLGRVNGLAMSACSAARTIAPPLVGIIYSAAGSAVAWWSIGGLAVVGIVEMWWVPREDVEGVVIENGLVGKREGNYDGDVEREAESQRELSVSEPLDREGRGGREGA